MQSILEQAGAGLSRRVAAQDTTLQGPLTVTAPQLLIARAGTGSGRFRG